MEYSLTQSSKRSKPILGGSTEDEYRRVMQQIMEGLTNENLETVRFLCKDHIPQGRQIKSPLQFFRYLEDRDLVSQEDAVFIAEVLHLIRRMDLLKIIPCIKNKKHFEEEYLSCTYTHFSNYRVLTIHLQDELSQGDFEKFRYHCSTHLGNRSLDDAENVLMLLKKLEELDVISHDNYEELINILKNVENAKPLKMFQRLLDGDESVVVNPNKQAKKIQQPPHYQAAFADRRSVQRPPPNQFVPEPNVEPHHMPPTYSMPGHAQPFPDEAYTIPKMNRGTEKETFTYDFTNREPLLHRGFSTRCFDSEESTPKSVGSGDGGHYVQEMHNQFRSMPYQGSQTPGLMRRFSDQASEYTSLPTRTPPPSYQSGYEGVPHVNTYPQNMNQLPQHQMYQRPQYHPEQQYPMQYDPQQIGYDSSPAMGPLSYNVSPPMVPHGYYSSMPHLPMQSPPGPQQYMNARSLVGPMNAMSTNDSDVGCILEEDEGMRNQANKATSGYVNSNIDVKAEAASSHHQKEIEDLSKQTEMEDLRKQNEELKRQMEGQKKIGCYKMDSSPVGLCLLINNVNFCKNFNQAEYDRRVVLNQGKSSRNKLQLPRQDMMDRLGSDCDAAKLENLFESFDFKVERHDDCDQREMLKLFSEASRTDHTRYNCFMLIILSHGDAGCVFGVDSFSIQIADIQKMFLADHCPTLASKPKIFIIQACQGHRDMTSHLPPEADIDSDGPMLELQGDRQIPNKSDFLVAYSTVPGYVSYRIRGEGTYYIMEVIETFKKNYEREDLLSMMVMVNNEMSKYKKTQVPMPVATLRKKVFFRRKAGWVDKEMDEEEAGTSTAQVSHVASSSNENLPGTSGVQYASSQSSEDEDDVYSHQVTGEQYE